MAQPQHVDMVAAGGYLYHTHLGSPQVFSDLNFTSGSFPSLLYNVLEESGKVTSAELEEGEEGVSDSMWSR